MIDDGRHPSVALITRDRPGLLATVTGVMTLHLVSVLEARAMTREDGVVIDLFTVSDALGRDVIESERWSDVERDLIRAFTGELDVQSATIAKDESYRATARPEVLERRSRLRSGDAEGEWVVEIRAPDRLGLLHDFTQLLAERGLDVRLAKIGTRGTVAADVFYATAMAGFDEVTTRRGDRAIRSRRGPLIPGLGATRLRSIEIYVRVTGETRLKQSVPDPETGNS